MVVRWNKKSQDKANGKQKESDVITGENMTGGINIIGKSTKSLSCPSHDATTRVDLVHKEGAHALT